MNDLLALAVPVEWPVQDATAFTRARALLRYADTVLFTVDPPPEGGRLAAAATLLTGVAEGLVAAVDPAFAGAPLEHPFWRSLSGGPLPAAWRALGSRATLASLTEQDVLDARLVAWAAVEKLDGPARARTRQSLLGWLKFAALAAAVGGAVFGVVSLWRDRPPAPGVLAGKPVRTSSVLGRDPGNARLLFHTENDVSPWAEWDLLAPTRLHEVTVTNRSDCCDERATPLVVEVSDDRARWTEVARRTERFTGTLTIPFKEVEARYLRLRVDRTSFLHLEAAEAR